MAIRGNDAIRLPVRRHPGQEALFQGSAICKQGANRGTGVAGAALERNVQRGFKVNQKGRRVAPEQGAGLLCLKRAAAERDDRVEAAQSAADLGCFQHTKTLFPVPCKKLGDGLAGGGAEQRVDIEK